MEAKRPMAAFHFAPINEAHTELVRVKELKKEEQCRFLSKRAFQSQQAASADSRLKAAAEVALARCGSVERQGNPFQNPNTHRYAKPQRQLKHQVLQGDGRAKMLSRVFLNGEWTYCA
mmetsp:Transcript_143974/g.203698  ORF Transcript_143974/g.203698 Transcript_143974/m.203698 type:complete len:118 (-) Transcript_143974:85-438(-)